MAKGHLHKSHADIVRRLKRATGHLTSVVTMIEEGKGCLDIAQQLQAVEKAVAIAKRTLIHDHIDHCLEHAVNPRGGATGESIDEFKQITKYL